jgi:hypothetical protein
MRPNVRKNCGRETPFVPAKSGLSYERPHFSNIPKHAAFVCVRQDFKEC